jgi:hypothetical protein
MAVMQAEAAAGQLEAFGDLLGIGPGSPLPLAPFGLVHFAAPCLAHQAHHPRGGKYDVREGTTRSRNVVIEFPDYQAALACYDSPEYQRAISFRTAASVGDLIILEGYDGRQPGD